MKFNTQIYAIFKVWLPIFLTPLFIFMFLYISGSYLTSSILQLLLGNEKKLLILEMCSYLNTSISLILSFVIIFQILSIVRKRNSEQFFNANGNVYYDHWYITFWLASKILGYKKIQLAGIPIGMQFKLVLNGTFPEITEDLWDMHYENIADVVLLSNKKAVEVEKLNWDCLETSSNLNLLICDTYSIDINQIDIELKSNPTLIVKSTVNEKQLRYLNKPLVNAVRSNVQSFARDKNVYIFSTANPKNNLNIITSCFRFFNRFPIKNVYVVQYGKDKKYNKTTKVI